MTKEKHKKISTHERRSNIEIRGLFNNIQNVTNGVIWPIGKLEDFGYEN